MKKLKSLKNIWNVLDIIHSEQDLLIQQLDTTLEDDFRELNTITIDSNDLTSCISNIKHILLEFSNVLNHPTKKQEELVEELIALSIKDRLHIEKNKLQGEIEKLEEEQLDTPEQFPNDNYVNVLNNIKSIRPDLNENNTLKNDLN